MEALESTTLEDPEHITAQVQGYHTYILTCTGLEFIFNIPVVSELLKSNIPRR